MNDSAAAPELSVVVVSSADFTRIRHTVRHLRNQTIQDRLELVIVAASREAVADHEPHELDGFRNVRIVSKGGPVANTDRALADGIRAAQAPVVALIEDHAFPDPTWAEAIIEAHRGPWVGVGSEIRNANPWRSTSWTSMLIAYGRWLEPAESGEVEEIALHNSTFKREALLAYGDALEDRLVRDGGLLRDLASRGGRFYLESASRLAHVNPSILSSMARLRFNAGRLYGTTRMEREGWSLLKRMMYVAGGWLIPVVRARNIHRELFAGGTRSELVPRVWPALMLGLVIDGLGEMTGYAAGAGSSREVLTDFEMDRLAHISKRERERIFGSEVVS